MSETDIELKKLNAENYSDIICCPSGLEVKGQAFKGDISKTLDWRKVMLENGMEGLIFYQKGIPTGFVEYMPGEKVPMPIRAPDQAVIMCFHWISPFDDTEKEHLDVEKFILESAVYEIQKRFLGVTALAWDHPEHFPIKMFQEAGFEEIESENHISLMWKSFDENAERPSMIGPKFEPGNRAKENELLVECGYSNRCPYSIHDRKKVKSAISRIKDDRMILKEYRLDTREEAKKYSRADWNWDWLYLNGEEIFHMKKTSEELEEIFTEKLEKLKN